MDWYSPLHWESPVLNCESRRIRRNTKLLDVERTRSRMETAIKLCLVVFAGRRRSFPWHFYLLFTEWAPRRFLHTMLLFNQKLREQCTRSFWYSTLNSLLYTLSEKPNSEATSTYNLVMDSQHNFFPLLPRIICTLDILCSRQNEQLQQTLKRFFIFYELIEKKKIPPIGL